MAYLAQHLSPEQRLAIESLLGRSVSQQQAITIRAYEPLLSSERRADIVAGLEAYFREVNAARQAGSPMLFEGESSALSRFRKFHTLTGVRQDSPLIGKQIANPKFHNEAEESVRIALDTTILVRAHRRCIPVR